MPDVLRRVLQARTFADVAEHGQGHLDHKRLVLALKVGHGGHDEADQVDLRNAHGARLVRGTHAATRSSSTRTESR